MKIDQTMVQALLAFIVGGGLLGLVTQVVRSWSSIKSGARANTREVIKDLAAARDESEDREATVRRDKDYWRGVAADYGFQLRSAGLTPDPAKPMSPSERAREMGQREQTRRIGQSRAARADAAPSTEEIDDAYGDPQ